MTIIGTDTFRVPVFITEGDGINLSQDGVSQALTIKLTDDVLDTIPITPAGISDATDGVIDITSALQTAINTILASRTSPSGSTGWGCNRLVLPKGKFKVTSGLTFASSAIGFELVGAGAHATSIEFANDSDSFITCNTFIHFSIRSLRINHIAQNADRTTWTNAMFTGTGTGGGRLLQLYNCAIYGFDRIIENTGSGNFDTFHADGCDFFNMNVAYYGRNSQAVANTFIHCTFYGKGDVMQIAGVGHTNFIGCNIVVDGAWLRLYGASGLFGPTSQYTFINTKGEPLNLSAYSGGSRSSIVALDGDKTQIVAQIKFINSGITSAVEFDTDTAYPQIEMTSKMNIDWEGGQIKNTAKIKLWPLQLDVFNENSHRGLFFDGLRDCPLPAQITREASSSNNTTYPQVTYERCQGIPNITIGAEVGTYLNFPPTVDRPQHFNCLGSGAHYYGVLSFGAALTHELDFHSSRQCVVDVAVQVVSKVGAANLKIETSLDNFSTVLDTFYVTGSAASTYLPTVRASDMLTGSKTFDWADLATATQQTTTVTVLGAAVGDIATVSMSTALSGTRIWGEVTAADTVTVYHRNDTGGNVNVASGTLAASVQKRTTVCNQVGNDKLYVRCSGPEAYGYIYATIRAA